MKINLKCIYFKLCAAIWQDFKNRLKHTQLKTHARTSSDFLISLLGKKKVRAVILLHWWKKSTLAVADCKKKLDKKSKHLNWVNEYSEMTDIRSKAAKQIICLHLERLEIA